MNQTENKLLLEAKNLKKFFPVDKKINGQKAEVKAVNDVSITIHSNEVYGLVGETGCGKSTLGRTLLRLMEATSGQILYKGQDITTIPQKEFRRYRQNLQMIFQDPYTSLNPRKNVGKILEEVLAIQGVKKPKERMDRSLEILDRVGLRPEHYYRYPHEFSGGQRQRVGIARALILNPEFIVCDEPVSALDVSIQSQIINLLLDLKERDHLSYLFIAHDIGVVRYISDRIGVMYLGYLFEEADTDELFHNPLHPYTQALLSSVPVIDFEKDRGERKLIEGELPSPLSPPDGCVFHTRCPYAKDICKKECPAMKKVGKGHRVMCHLYDTQKEEFN